MEISLNDKCRCLNFDVLKLVIIDDWCIFGLEVGKIYFVLGCIIIYSYYFNVIVNFLYIRLYIKLLEIVCVEIEINFVVMNNIDVNFGDGLLMSIK